VSDTVIGRKAPTTPATTGQKRWVKITLWVVQVVLAISFAGAGFQKLGGTHYMVTMFGKIGAGQWLRYLTGALEVCGAVGLLIPVISGLTALAFGALMVGATITNITISYNPWVPVLFLVLSAVVARGRWPQTKSLAGKFRR
jgi:putative oxidoreductase